MANRTRGLPKARHYSKLMGLQALEKLTHGVGLTLPFSAVKARKAGGGKAGKSLQKLVGPGHDRVQVRMDAKGRGHMTNVQWITASNEFVPVDPSNLKPAEESVNRWMRRNRKKHTVFVLHALRPFSQYHRQGQVSYNGENGFIVFQHGGMKSDKGFRNTPMPLVVMDLRGRVKSSHGSPEIPGALRTGVMRLVRRVRKAYPGEKHFELRFVTYKDAPEKPEYYDLLFGKKDLEIGWLKGRNK